ncbi:hypothetical protein PCANC_26870 [Puccinia coronata f. sp. avenae]|uniref:Uncharacterized protein n=1 Tax=Puccinia coronata f. sp. avenae TaxID=200324 RepID=A0A2N5TLU5_9BASI|nr:hypothetical protein PCANC_26870 [Puccinia coronata f. sp. avenae]
MPKPERTRPSTSELSTSSTPSMRPKSMTTASGKTSPLITSNVSPLCPSTSNTTPNTPLDGHEPESPANNSAKAGKDSATPNSTHPHLHPLGTNVFITL